jgi:CheY-like chemotaxis protein
MPNGGELVIRARSVETLMRPDGTPGGRAVQIEVVDSGVGMDEQVRQRCLEPFFTTKGERGTGLGLAMVFGIVQRHGGEIAIDSAVGRGTTFRLSFFNLTMARSPTVQELAQVPRRLRLLLIDDDPIVIKALSDLLNDDGHELTTANGGQAGIDAFRASLATSSRIAVVITDLGMPQVDGRRVAEAVKTASPTTPVLMLTGWGKRLNEDDQLPVHVDMVLSKPPKIHEIRAALHQLCSR